jgi:LuxR family maltose regulon positive regulatory protein
LVFVLDDYHLVTHPDVHSGVTRMLRHLPHGVTMAVATRTEPPLPLSRLRANGELVEVDAEALSFTADEALEFFTGLHGLALDPAEATRLRDRAEGWAAGLYLAALSLRGRADPRAFVEAFAGDDRNVVDYLSEEVRCWPPPNPTPWPSCGVRRSCAVCRRRCATPSPTARVPRSPWRRWRAPTRS